jgi:hypothetical protein
MCCFYVISYLNIELKVILHANMNFLYLIRPIPDAKIQTVG